METLKCVGGRVLQQNAPTTPTMLQWPINLDLFFVALAWPLKKTPSHVLEWCFLAWQWCAFVQLYTIKLLTSGDAIVKSRRSNITPDDVVIVAREVAHDRLMSECLLLLLLALPFSDTIQYGFFYTCFILTCTVCLYYNTASIRFEIAKRPQEVQDLFESHVTRTEGVRWMNMHIH